MLVHFRVTAPADLARDILRRWMEDPRLVDVVHLPGVVRPAGDLLEADVAREAASDILEQLDRAGVRERGGVAISQPLGTPSAAAEEAERAARGDPDDAVIWSLVEDEAQAASRATPSYLVFLLIAVVLAGIAVLTDSAVLVVGAMVVGPDFSVVAATCTGVALGRWRLAGRALWLLIWSFALVTAVVAAAAFAALHAGAFTPEEVTRARPQTGFIWRPDIWSFVVALLAGAAGVWAQTTDKTSAMVGVFISVTTVPAAGNLALGVAIGSAAEIAGSASQLGLNVLGLLVAGVATLLLQRIAWRHLDADRRARLGRLLSPAPAHAHPWQQR